MLPSPTWRPALLHILLVCQLGACGGQSSQASANETTPSAGTEAAPDPADEGSANTSVDAVCADTAPEETACERDEDCPAPGHCLGGVCSEGESGGVSALMEDCGEDGSCPSGLSCDSSSGVCRETCAAHADCVTGWYCEGGFCAACTDRDG